MRAGRAWGAFGVVAALGAWLASGLYTVPSTSLGVTRLFGAVIDASVPPGVHWFWPAPVGRVDRVEVTTSLSLPIGQLAPDEPQTVTPGLAIGRWLTGDTNLIELRAKVNYRIGDPAKYLFGSDAPRALLRNAVGAAMTEAASGQPVDELLTSGRLALMGRIRERAQALLDGYGVGLQILAVNVETIEPPANVLQAFQDVQNARADRERSISEAQSYANGILPVARGESQRRLSEAASFADQRTSAARGDADAFRRLVVEHRRAPALLEERLYVETLERVLPRVKRYVIDPGGGATVPLRIVE